MATITCGTGGTYATLALAQTAASNGDTLEIQPGTYSGAGWADVTISKVLAVIDTLAGFTLQDTTGSVITMQGNGSMLDVRYSAIESSSTGTAIAVSGAGIWVRANITNTNASGEALSVASGATGGDYQIEAECTAASTSFGIKISTTGNPGLFHDCRLTGYQYAFEWSGTAQTAHFVRRCIIVGSSRGCSVPYKATLVNCVFDTCTDGCYSGTDVTVHHCTFTQCGDGIHALAVGQYLGVKNSIFTGCTAGLRGVAGDEAAPDYCNFSDNVADVVNWTAPTNSVAGDPLLDSVTYTPAEGSPVVDAGTDLGYTDDLYHASAWRPQGAAPDVGAVEREVSLPPEPPTPLTGRRHEVHRIWPGGSVGTVTIGATDYAVIVPRARENLHLWVARVVLALETATGLDWSGWLTSTV
jgi:hypothetical protein